MDHNEASLPSFTIPPIIIFTKFILPFILRELSEHILEQKVEQPGQFQLINQLIMAGLTWRGRNGRKGLRRHGSRLEH